MAQHAREGIDPVLDDVSRMIVEQLQQDGRRPYHAVGAAVGLSEAAVRQRVQRLLAAGVMQVVAVTDPGRLGYHRQAMVGVRCSGDIEEAAGQLAKLPEVDYVVITAGRFDLLVEVICVDDEDLLRVLHEVRAVPAVAETDIFMYLRVAKETYAWGTG